MKSTSLPGDATVLRIDESVRSVRKRLPRVVCEIPVCREDSAIDQIRYNFVIGAIVSYRDVGPKVSIDQYVIFEHQSTAAEDGGLVITLKSGVIRSNQKSPIVTCRGVDLVYGSFVRNRVRSGRTLRLGGNVSIYFESEMCVSFDVLSTVEDWIIHKWIDFGMGQPIDAFWRECCRTHGRTDQSHKNHNRKTVHQIHVSPHGFLLDTIETGHIAGIDIIQQHTHHLSMSDLSVEICR